MLPHAHHDKRDEILVRKAIKSFLYIKKNGFRNYNGIYGLSYKPEKSIPCMFYRMLWAKPKTTLMVFFFFFFLLQEDSPDV